MGKRETKDWRRCSTKKVGENDQDQGESEMQRNLNMAKSNWIEAKLWIKLGGLKDGVASLQVTE